MPQERSDDLKGFDLILRCDKCNLKKKIAGYPTAGAPPRGTNLGVELKKLLDGKGCIRCGAWSFVVESDPPAKEPGPPPVGWVKKPG